MTANWFFLLIYVYLTHHVRRTTNTQQGQNAKYSPRSKNYVPAKILFQIHLWIRLMVDNWEEQCSRDSPIYPINGFTSCKGERLIFLFPEFSKYKFFLIKFFFPQLTARRRSTQAPSGIVIAYHVSTTSIHIYNAHNCPFIYVWH